MKYQVQENCLTVFLPRELDHHNAEEIRKESDHLIEHNHIRYVIFDFAETNFMDSSGIGLLLNSYRRMREQGGTVAVLGVGRRMNQMLAISGIYQVIDCIS